MFSCGWAVISLLMIGSGRQLIPGRLQSVAEISYEFVATMLRSSAGSEGHEVFFPLVFSLFMFIAVLEPGRDHSLHLHRIPATLSSR